MAKIKQSKPLRHPTPSSRTATREITSNPAAMDQIRKSRADIAAGRLIPHEQVKANLEF